MPTRTMDAGSYKVRLTKNANGELVGVQLILPFGSVFASENVVSLSIREHPEGYNRERLKFAQKGALSFVRAIVSERKIYILRVFHKALANFTKMYDDVVNGHIKPPTYLSIVRGVGVIGNNWKEGGMFLIPYGDFFYVINYGDLGFHQVTFLDALTRLSNYTPLHPNGITKVPVGVGKDGEYKFAYISSYLSGKVKVVATPPVERELFENITSAGTIIRFNDRFLIRLVGDNAEKETEVVARYLSSTREII